MTLHDISNQIESKTISFLFFKQSCLYLEDYLSVIFRTDNIELLDERMTNISDARNINASQRAYVLTSTMLVNRVFTLIDSYFSSLAHEMAFLSNNYFCFSPHTQGEPTKPIRNDRNRCKLVLNRLKIDTNNYSFYYPRGHAELINVYDDYYNEIRNPNTHNSSTMGHFNPTLKTLVLSISRFDLDFYESLQNDSEVCSHLDNDKYLYFRDTTSLTLSQIFALMHQEMSNEAVRQIQNIVDRYGEETTRQYEQDYSEFLKQVFVTNFNIFCI